MSKVIDEVVDDPRADFEMVTSDQPDVIQRALAKEGVTEATTDDEGSGESASAGDGTAGSGDGSDPSVGNQDNDEGGEQSTSNDGKDDEKIVEVDIDGDKVKVSKGLNKRFGKLTAKVGERDRTIVELQRQLDEAKAVKPAEPVKPAEKTEATIAAETVIEKFVAEAEPQADKFPTYGEFIVAHASWARKAVQDATEFQSKQTAKLVKDAIEKVKSDIKSDIQLESANQKADRELAEIKSAFETRQATVATANPDFDELVRKNKNGIKVHTEMQRVYFTHPRGPEIQLWLARNPAEAARILATGPSNQAIEAGIIIGKLGAPKTPKSLTTGAEGSGAGANTGTHKTNPPPKPLPRGSAAGNRGSAAKMTNKRAETLDFDEYYEGRSNGTIR